MNATTTGITFRQVWTVTRIAILLLVFGPVHTSHGLMWIWDSTDLKWSTTLTDGAPIDTGNPENAVDPQVAIDSTGKTYVAFKQDDTEGTGIGRIYLSRYDRSGEVRIWDHDTRSWTTTLSDGDPIDTGISGLSAQTPQLAIDSFDRVYVVFAQSDGARDRIYLSRFDGTDVRIYGAGFWTTSFTAGRPIDANTGNPAKMPRLAIDSNDQVYVTFYQNNGLENHIYLSRYNGLDVRIWDNDTSNWVASFASGDPIDTTLAREADSPEIAIDSGNRVYVAYRQNDGAFFNIFLSRYSVTNELQIWDSGTSNWTSTLTNGSPIGLSGASGDATGLHMAVDSSDQVYIACAQQDAGNDRIFLSRYNGGAVQIWGAPWTSDFSLATPVDTGDTPAAIPRVATDSGDNIYVAFGQLVSGISRIHLIRWNKTDVQIWDTGVPGWTTTLSDGDPVDAATGQSAFAPKIAADTVDRVYIAFHQMNGLTTRVYLSRYDGAAVPSSPVVETWNQDNQAWTTTFSDGDPIDAGTGGSALSPRLAADSVDEVFIAYYQDDGPESHIFLNAYENSGTPPDDGEEDSSGSCFLSAMGDGTLHSDR